MNNAASDAIRTSHAHARESPAPAATPFTPAMTGLGSPTMAAIMRL